MSSFSLSKGNIIDDVISPKPKRSRKHGDVKKKCNKENRLSIPRGQYFKIRTYSFLPFLAFIITFNVSNML